MINIFTTLKEIMSIKNLIENVHYSDKYYIILGIKLSPRQRIII